MLATHRSEPYPMAKLLVQYYPFSAPGDSELTDNKTLLSTTFVVPLAIGEDLHTVL